jgi:diguanylate cyclase (GGDEF)-like protein/PAS domain S-box-containing protein
MSTDARAAQAGAGGAVRMRRDGSSHIVAIEGDITGLLGWSPNDMIGRASTEFIHPMDQPSAISAWLSMVEAPNQPITSRGRYRTADGRWLWVEAVNTNRLADPDHGCVHTVMYPIKRSELSVEEQLRAQEQLLNRLSDALPVGLVHFDVDGAIIATNHRLDVIVGRADSSTFEELFELTDTDDGQTLTSAIASTLHDEAAIDDIEIHLTRPSGSEVVCSISMRSLTDDDGTVTGAVATVDDVTDRVMMRRQLEHRAETDALTSCLNRRAVLEVLDTMIGDIGDDGTGVAAVFLDLDGFKQINDTLGHAIGDEVLATVAFRLRDIVRDVDRVGRLGGDEFLIVAPEIAGPDGAEQIGRQIAAAVNIEHDSRGQPVSIRASIGVAYTDGALGSDALVASADAAMYRSKQQRRSDAAVIRPDAAE